MKLGGDQVLQLNEMVREVRRLEKEAANLPPVRLLYLTNVTSDLLLPNLKYGCFCNGLKPEIRTLGGNDVLQIMMDPPSNLLAPPLDMVGLWVHLETFGSLQSDFEEPVLRCIESALKAIRQRTDAFVLLHTFEVPVLTPGGIRDASNAESLVHRVRRLNRDLLDLAGRHQGLLLLDTEQLQARLGQEAMFDRRFWHMARAPYTLAGMREVAGEALKVLRAIKGLTRKCLVLDCDNTLWGGILGEMGPEGIQLGGDYPGSAFQEFQNVVHELNNNGVVLCLCSKNNENDVFEVLDHHPEMVLRRDHFAAVRINWRDKAANLRELAAELNLGLDSFVFVDDNPFETELVDRLLPQVAVIQLPEDPSAFTKTLLAPGFFDFLALTEEDSERARMYGAEAKRRALASRGYGSIEDYFAELDMEMEIGHVDGLTAPRAAQLSQRSNQFNLTTIRYTENDILGIAGQDDAAVRVFRLRDRFGDMGIVGVTVLRFAGSGCVIEALFMSCRALGRQAEKVLLRDCEIMAGQRGCSRLVGRFRATEKNGQVEMFYPDNGFIPCGREKEPVEYCLDVGTPGQSPAHIRVASHDWEPDGGRQRTPPSCSERATT